MPHIRIKYDKHWKEVVTHLFDHFVAFFLPDLYQEIDWTIAPEFLEKELFELAKSRGFDLHEFTRLTIFAVNLMQMSDLLEAQFEKEVLYPKIEKNTNMYKASIREKRFISHIYESVYGQNAEIMATELQTAKSEVKSAKIEVKATQAKAIVVCYTKAAMSIEAIAEELNLTKAQVRKTLRENNLIE